MPIIVKDFTWTQSESRICINLPLKGTKSSNLDILNSLEFVKVSYPPFLFECWFNDKVRDEKCTAIVNNGVISMQFNKMEEKIWPDLFHPDHQSKELLKIVREEAIKFAGERAERLAKQKTEDINQNKKIALKEQMKIEEEERKRIEQIKEEEKRKATEEIEKLKEIQKNAFIQEELAAKIETPCEKKITLESIKDEIKNINKEIFNECKDAPKQEEKKVEQEIRQQGTIKIKLTPRVFPTPQRESTDQAEKEWLQKQAEARKLTDLSDDMKDLTANEKNLDWLKEKASSLYKQENYQTAIGVYNHAIKVFPRVASLYSNRGTCHYKVKNLMKCIEDCAKALELLTPPVASNAESRFKAHVRRGTAFCDLSLFAEGLLDLEAGLKIKPNDVELKQDADRVRKIILGKQPEDKDEVIENKEKLDEDDDEDEKELIKITTNENLDLDFD